MDNVTCFIMSTTTPSRWPWLEQSIDLIDNQNLFKNKILFVDEINDYKFPDELKNKFTLNGWNVIIDRYLSRAKSTEVVLNSISTEWVFYSEDDILNYFPPDIKLIFEILSNKIINNKQLGTLTFNISGSTYHCANKIGGDLKFYKINTILENEEYVVFKRMENFAGPWFFSFPSIFIRNDIFKQCNDYAIKNLAGMQIEMGLTRAYFDLSIDKKYYKLSIAKKAGLDKLINFENIQDIEYSYIDLLDSNQGGGGNSISHSF